MRHWKIMDYYSPGGENLIWNWYELQGPAVQANFKYAVNEIAATPNLDEEPAFNPLRNDHRGLFTIRLEIVERQKKRHFRPVGFWGPNTAELVLVDGYEKSGRSSVPPGVLDNVLDVQLSFYYEGKGTLYDHSF
jgi:hypothetical protein